MDIDIIKFSDIVRKRLERMLEADKVEPETHDVEAWLELLANDLGAVDPPRVRDIILGPGFMVRVHVDTREILAFLIEDEDGFTSTLKTEDMDKNWATMLYNALKTHMEIKP